MKEINEEQRARDLVSHAEWLADHSKGARLDWHGCSLSEANLRGANLRGANLRGADLSWASLSEAKGFLRIGPIGSRADWLDVTYSDDGIKVKTGCFYGSLAEFAKRVKETH